MNLEYVSVCFSSPSLVILRPDPHTQIMTSLQFNTAKSSMRTLTEKDFQNILLTTIAKFSLFMGVVRIEGEQFFVFCEKCKKVGHIKSHAVFQVKTVRFVPFSLNLGSDDISRWELLLDKFAPSIRDKLKVLDCHLSRGYYFSYSYDLSKCFDKTSDDWGGFFTTSRMINFLALDDLAKPWIIPVVEGFIKTIDLTIADQLTVRYTLVCRVKAAEDKLIEITALTECQNNLMINRMYLSEFQPEKILDNIIELCKKNRRVMIVNCISRDTKKDLEKMADVEETIGLLTSEMENLKYKYLNTPIDKVASIDLLFGLESTFKENIDLVAFFNNTHFNSNDFKRDDQKGFFKLLFHERPSNSALICTLYLSFFNLRNIIQLKCQKSLPQRGPLTLSQIEAFSKKQFFKAFYQLFKNAFLLIDDTCDNIFTRLWIGVDIESQKEISFLDSSMTRDDLSLQFNKEQPAQLQRGNNRGNINEMDVDFLSFDIGGPGQAQQNLQQKFGNYGWQPQPQGSSYNPTKQTNQGLPQQSQFNPNAHPANKIRRAETMDEDLLGLNFDGKNFISKKPSENDNRSHHSRRNQNKSANKVSSRPNSDDIHNNFVFLKGKKKNYHINRNKAVFRRILHNPNFEISLEEKKYNGFRLFVMTWNLSGISAIMLSSRMTPIYNKIKETKPDVICFGFQEIVELKITLKNIKNMINTEMIVQQWENILKAYLSNYKLYFHKNLLGLETFLLVHKDKINSMFSVDDLLVKLGIMNIGNKGAISVVFNFKNHYTEIVNCHLSAGNDSKAFEARLNDLDLIFEKVNNNFDSKRVYNSLLIGDFNFKIINKTNQTNDIVAYQARRNPTTCYNEFKEQDEMKSVWTKQYFQGYQEMPITFPPTYKYSPETGHLEHKSRTPSWCDRIIFKERRKSKLKILEYGAFNIMASDHLPVYLITDVLEH